MVIIIMGVSGVGKSTVGQQLADAMSWEFADADSFHSQENINKMSAGIPLTDEDRLPWLLAIQDAIQEWLQNGQNRILACSALKAGYRQALYCHQDEVKLVYLKGSFELIYQRMQARQDHFMQENLLKSQFDALEEPTPEEAIYINVKETPEAVVAEIKSLLQL